MSRLRNFMFTINNYTKEDIEQLKCIEYKYLIFGKEKGEKGTPHLQGYCELEKQTTRSKISKIIPRAWLEARKGSQEQAVKYVSKDGDITEWGAMREQGMRGDLDNIREIAAEQGMREVTAIGNSQQIAVAQKYLTYNEDKRDWKPEVIWICGPSGCGKSRKAREIAGEDVYCKMNGSKWWDGYDKHSSIVWDDFRDKDMDYHDLLRFLDRYEYQVEVKGGWRQILAKTIIVTSIKHPSRIYKYVTEERKQFDRRISKIIVMENYSEVTEGNNKNFCERMKSLSERLSAMDKESDDASLSLR